MLQEHKAILDKLQQIKDNPQHQFQNDANYNSLSGSLLWYISSMGVDQNSFNTVERYLVNSLEEIQTLITNTQEEAIKSEFQALKNLLDNEVKIRKSYKIS